MGRGVWGLAVGPRVGLGRGVWGLAVGPRVGLGRGVWGLPVGPRVGLGRGVSGPVVGPTVESARLMRRVRSGSTSIPRLSLLVPLLAPDLSVSHARHDPLCRPVHRLADWRGPRPWAI